jgi:hypothetical protein
MGGTLDGHTPLYRVCPSARFVLPFLIQTSNSSGCVRPSSASSRISFKSPSHGRPNLKQIEPAERSEANPERQRGIESAANRF